MSIQKEGYDSMRGNAQKIQIQMNKFSKERSCTSYLTILRKTKVWVPLESSQVVRTQPKIPLIKTSYQQLWLWKDSCTVVLCYNCPACNGSVTSAIIIPETITETWQPSKLWTVTQTVSDIKSPLCLQFHVTVQIKLEPTLGLAKGAQCTEEFLWLKIYMYRLFLIKLHVQYHSCQCLTLTHSRHLILLYCFPNRFSHYWQRLCYYP